MGMWITNNDFADLPLIDVFDKEHGKKEILDSTYFNKHILFRKKFDAEKTEKAIVRISADDYYKLYINGSFVCMGPSPAYPHKYYYNEIDVTDMICEGTNTVAVHTYYMGKRNRVCVSGDNMHGLFFELYADGKLELCSDESWKTAYHTGYTELGLYGYETSYLECYNSSSAEVGFENPDFDDGLWENATENKTIGKYNILCSRTPLLDVYKIKPEKVETIENTVRIDIGTGICGYLEYKAKGVAGSEITILTGEELNDDGSVRFDARCNCRFEEKHILSGGTDILCQFDYKGMRYIELVLPDGCVLDYDSVKIIVRHHSYEEKADISTQNERLARIFRMCADTVKYGVQEVCVDCPTREKGQYLGDAGIIAMVHASLTDSTEVLEKVLREFADSSFVCPGIMAISTSSFNQEIADYSLMYPLFALWCYRKNRNIEFLREIYPAMKGMIRYFAERMKDGVVCDVVEKWNLVDWPWNLRDGYDFVLDNPPPPGKHNVIAAYYIGACMCFEEIRRILGKPEMCDIETMKEAFVTHYYDSEAGLFRDTPDSGHHALHSNVLPLLFDIGMNPELKKRIIGIIREKRFESCNYFAFFVLLALEKEGETELIRELICDDGAWNRMLENGATVCYETWAPDLKWNTSLFHPWMSYPVLFADKIK